MVHAQISAPRPTPERLGSVASQNGVAAYSTGAVLVTSTALHDQFSSTVTPGQGLPGRGRTQEDGGGIVIPNKQKRSDGGADSLGCG